MITLADSLGPNAHGARLCPGVCRIQDAVGSSKVTKNDVPLEGIFDRNDSRGRWHKECRFQKQNLFTQLLLYDGELVTVGQVVGWCYQLPSCRWFQHFPSFSFVDARGLELKNRDRLDLRQSSHGTIRGRFQHPQLMAEGAGLGTFKEERLFHLIPHY